MADYRQLVETSVRKAFDKIGTLAKVVTFASNQATDFDFASLAAEVTPLQSISIKAVILEAEKSRGKDANASANTQKKRLLLISKDTPSLNSYDTVTVDGVTWKVAHPIKDDGYTITVDVFKEL